LIFGKKISIILAGLFNNGLKFAVGESVDFGIKNKMIAARTGHAIAVFMVAAARRAYHIIELLCRLKMKCDFIMVFYMKSVKISILISKGHKRAQITRPH
jgi:hypothetical protein